MRVCNLTAMALLARSACAWTHSSEDELRKQLAENDDTLVAFVHSDTAACKALEPEWEQLESKKQDAVSVDCKALPGLCAELDVASYPSIRLYQRDAPMVRYRGAREASSIISFLRRIRRPVVTELTAKEMLSFVTIDDVVLIGILHTDEDTKLRDQFVDSAKAYRDRFSFGLADAAKGSGGVRCYNNAEDSQHAIPAAELDYRVGALDRLVKNCTMELIPQLTIRNEMLYLQPGKSFVYYFSDDGKDRGDYTKLMKPLARTYREYLQLVTVDSAQDPDMARDFGLAKARGLSVQNPHTGQIFPYDGAIAPDDVAQFIMSISKGEVRPWKGHGDTLVQASHDEL